MKKVMNKPEDIVKEMLEGMSKAHRRLVEVIPGTQAVVRADAPVMGKVAVITGGGSGHEPAHGGFVGKGMLDAALAGAVFCSPPLSDGIAALERCNGGKGALFIIKNYTGDILLFDMLEEEAQDRDIPVKKVLVTDDVAVEEREGTTGRRGVAGTVFVHKIAGAMADKRAPLEEVHRVAQKCVDSVRTLGVALSPCIVPGRDKPNFELGADEMELGIGIHGEPGVERTSLRPARELVEGMMGRIVGDLPFERGQEVAVMVNGMGATPLMELYVVFNEVAKYLDRTGIDIYRSYVGEYMTSLEMAGFSITLLALDEELKSLLDHPCETPALTQR
ncbi:dihydroxyacetone kinase subunit DhaK [Acetomicrobium sp. S15 = DSM 107314]|jgi:dihydroxyacetone kinase-like protein|uniref:dihydroxyacetone kinase subunit DhaK n=1 Tax=Acetomicrobium sp. S15 = DSM 107314 TaxID=2529858 RepID=UPI0018E0CFC7|nr:dihydroxyacetone kinase subunit DhaK [Acetomicrobium sp. S15 = DSM 107314]